MKYALVILFIALPCLTLGYLYGLERGLEKSRYIVEEWYWQVAQFRANHGRTMTLKEAIECMKTLETKILKSP